MSKIDIAYIPIVGRGLQINIICALHEIETNMMMSKLALSILGMFFMVSSKRTLR